MDTAIRQRILSLNPWFEDPSQYQIEISRRLPEYFVSRQIDFTSFEDPNRIKLIIGPRQSGKSTLIWSFFKRYVSEKVLFLNAEELLIQKWAESAAEMIHGITKHFPSVTSIFLDEVQHLNQAGLTLKGLVDAKRGFNIFATGSSSFHLMDRTRESLAGRAERRVLLPFSIRELSESTSSPIPGAQIEKVHKLIERMYIIGSYPGVWFADQPQRELFNLVESFVIRDVSDRFRIQRPDAFRRLMQLLARQTGQMNNFTELASHLGISVSTVREYVNILEETWVIKLLPAFAEGKRREITTANKIHFIDQGIRNAVLGMFNDDIESRPDSGSLFEGFALSEILKELSPIWTVHYWRAKGGAKVDFVLVLGKRLVGVDVKISPRPRLTKSSLSFIQAYAPELFIIVSRNEIKWREKNIGQTQVISLTIEKFGPFLSNYCNLNDRRSQ